MGQAPPETEGGTARGKGRLTSEQAGREGEGAAGGMGGLREETGKEDKV